MGLWAYFQVTLHTKIYKGTLETCGWCCGTYFYEKTRLIIEHFVRKEF